MISSDELRPNGPQWIGFMLAMCGMFVGDWPHFFREIIQCWFGCAVL